MMSMGVFLSENQSNLIEVFYGNHLFGEFLWMEPYYCQVQDASYLMLANDLDFYMYIDVLLILHLIYVTFEGKK